MEKVSFIVTSYNHQKFIQQTLQSILNQTYTDWELLVWDDNSSDDTFEIIQEIAKQDQRIHIWKHPENLGIVGNMNFLLSHVSSQSKYVAFLEWDDVITSDYLIKKLSVFHQYKEVVLVYNNLDFIDETGKIFERNFLKKSPHIVKNELLSKMNFVNLDIYYYSYSSLMIKKEILEKEKILNISENKLYSVSDWDLFFRISTKYPCYWMQESVTLYRKHQNNFSHQKSRKTQNPILRDMFLLIDFYKKQNILSQEQFLRFHGTLLYAKSFESLFIWEKKQAFEYFWKSLLLTKKIRIVGTIKFLAVALFWKYLIK